MQKPGSHPQEFNLKKVQPAKNLGGKRISQRSILNKERSGPQKGTNHLQGSELAAEEKLVYPRYMS